VQLHHSQRDARGVHEASRRRANSVRATSSVENTSITSAGLDAGNGVDADAAVLAVEHLADVVLEPP